MVSVACAEYLIVAGCCYVFLLVVLSCCDVAGELGAFWASGRLRCGSDAAGVVVGLVLAFGGATDGANLCVGAEAVALSMLTDLAAGGTS